jgi:hypothetical protein
MALDKSRSVVATAILVELGALVGSALGWLFLVGHTVLWEGPLWVGPSGGNNILGALFAGVLFGAPFGALTVTTLGMTVLRRVPIRRALRSLCFAGLIGIGVSAVLDDRLSVVTPMLLTAATMTAGAVAAQMRSARERNQIDAPAAAS